MPRFALALFTASALFSVMPLTALAQDDTSGEDAMLVRLNELRAAQGLGALIRDAQLDAAARRHSHDMADHDQLMHVSETTGTPTDRVHAAGIATDEIAENVAMHHDTAQAEATLEASAPHLANIVNPRFTHVGLASILDGDGTYVTQVFGRIEASAPAAPSAPEIIPPSVTTAPTVVAPTVVAPMDVTPSITVETEVAPPTPSATGQAVVVPPSSSGVVSVPPARPGVAGYWVCGSGRWWYYPIPAGATGGSQLQPDLSVSGPPPGYAGACGGSTYAVAPRPAPPPVYRPAPSYPGPSYPPPSYPYQPAPRYSAPVVVTPGVVIGPWGGGVRVEVGPSAPMYAPAPVYVRPPRVYGRGRRGWRGRR